MSLVFIKYHRYRVVTIYVSSANKYVITAIQYCSFQKQPKKKKNKLTTKKHFAKDKVHDFELGEYSMYFLLLFFR